MKYLLFALILVGCGSKAVNDPIFDQYKAHFEEEAAKHGKYIKVGVPMAFGVMPKSETVGFCEREGGDKYIVISERHWNKFTEEEKNTLVGHELGHCALNRKHNDNIAPDGCPESLMYWRVVEVWCFKRFKKDYYDELFK